MKASVIIPTHNREKILGRVLSYYGQQDLPKNRYEVIVVDDGSSDKTPFIFKGLKDIIDYPAKPWDSKCRSRVISAKQGLFDTDKDEGPQRKQDPINLKYIQLEKSGRSISRNTGIFFSSHPLIIFADDDIFVETGFVKKHIEAHAPDDMCVVMGKVIHTGDLEDPLSARWKPKDINTAFLATGNASVLKKYLFQAGLFDEDYTVYGWEDFDLGIHLEDNGLESQKRKIYGYHYDPPGNTLKPGALYSKEKERGLTAVYLYRNHPLRWVKRFTLINNKFFKVLSRFLGRGNWFLGRDRITFLRGFFRLVIRYKGYFDGVDEGLKLYGAENGNYMKNADLPKKDLIIFSNGPGEVTTWVLPVIEAVREKEDLTSKYRIILIIQPCPFGSGAEGTVAAEFEGVETVIMPGKYLKILFTGFGKRKYRFSREGLIFSLGGDLMHPVLFRKRIKGNHLLYAYTKNPGWGKYYEKIFVRNDYVKNKMLGHGIAPGKLSVVGDLVYSSLKYSRTKKEVRKEVQVKDDEKMIIFLAGSRDFEVRYMMPIFLKVINDLSSKVKGIKPFFLKSPYMSYDFIEKAVENGGKLKIVESIPGELKRSDGNFFPFIEFGEGKKVYILEKGLEHWGRGVDFAVTIPGTNTIQLAYRKIPSLVVAPLNKPELYPVEGPFGLLKWVPVVGKMILKKAVFRYLKKFPYASLPNMYAGKEIFPELFKEIRTDEITEKIVEIFENGTDKKIAGELDMFKPDSDPVDLIVGETFAKDKI